MKLIIDIFENQDTKPILRHEFFGDTQQDVLAVVAAHRKTDSFFNGALAAGKWDDIPLRYTYKWLV